MPTTGKRVAQAGKTVKTYNDIFDVTLGHEGGYVNDPNDRGGETNFGISKRWHPNVDIKNLTKSKAATIYKKDYYDKMQGDKLPVPVALPIFDMAINSGISRAVKLIQGVVGETVDGIIGNKTINAIQEFFTKDPIGLLDSYRDARINYYESLDQFDRYGRGWTNRATQVNEKAKEWTEAP